MNTRSTGLIWILGLFFIATGISQLIGPVSPLVIATGMAAIAGGGLFLVRRTRKIGAVLMILALVALLPASIRMAAGFFRTGNIQQWTYLFRVPVQLILIFWIASYIKNPE